MSSPDTAVLARIRQMADYWEQHLPEVIRTPAVVSALRAALEPAAVEPSADQAALRQHAEAALAAVEAALGDTLLPAAREEALAGITAVLPEPADRAAVLREAAVAVAADDAHIPYGSALAYADRHSALLRRMADETPAAEAADPDETDEQRADREETERDHAAGTHQYCGVTCEAEFPSEMLRNTILYRAIPGSKTMLAELERRAAVAATAEHCTHSSAIHARHHHTPVTGCPWCTAAEQQQDGSTS